MKGKIITALVLAEALFVQGAVAQDVNPLRIQVVEGENAFHNLKRKAVSPTVVEVRDAENRPVPDARVRFTLPAVGPGGRFSQGERTFTTHADSQGRAAMASFSPNEYQGAFTVVVEANSAGRAANTAVKQTNAVYAYAPPVSSVRAADSVPTMRTSNTRKLLLILGIGAAAAVAGIMASQGGARSAAPGVPPTTIGIGGIGVGGPQ